MNSESTQKSAVAQLTPNGPRYSRTAAPPKNAERGASLTTETERAHGTPFITKSKWTIPSLENACMEIHHGGVRGTISPL